MQLLKSLLTSRKFWLTVISLASAIGAYVHHDIAAPQLANIIAGSVAVLVIAIAHEDNGTNSAPQVVTGGPTTVVSPDATIPIDVPSIPPKI